jgi:TPR repeat protein
MYFNGKGTTRDYAQAIAWFNKAASQGSAAAQANLGIMYLNGLGVSPDRSKAREWLQQAALQQNASAKHWLDVIDKQTPPPSTQSPPITMSSIAHSNLANDADAHNNPPINREIANLQ